MQTTTNERPFSALLRAYRVAAGLSQEELAERAHVSRRTISDLERGITTAPYRDTVALLADALALDEHDRVALEDADFDRAARLIRQAASPLLARGETQTLITWLRALPEVSLHTAPQLALLYAWLLIDQRDPEGAERYLHYAEAALDDPDVLAYDELSARLLFLRDLPPQTPETRAHTVGVSTIRAMIGAARAIVSALHGEPAHAVAQAQAALAELDASDVRSRSLAGIGLGLAHLSQGTARQAAEAFHGVTVANQDTPFSLFRVLAAVGEASAQRLAGALDQARSTYEQAIVWSTAQDTPSLLAGSLYTGLADLLRERNELDSALEHATQGLRLVTELEAERAERWIEWQACNLLVLARIKQAQGDLDGALGVVQEAQEALAGGGAISCAAILAAFSAQLHLAQGDLDYALRWWQDVEERAEPRRFGLTPQIFVYAGEHMEIAPIQVLLAQGRASGSFTPVRRALTLLDKLLERAEHTDLVWLQTRALALQALAYQALDQMAPALAALKSALALAQPAGYIRLFVDEGQPLADLLRQMRAQGHGAEEYVAAVLAAFDYYATGTGERQAAVSGASAWPSPHAASPAPVPAVEALTEREHEVLRLMAVGHSNPAIARALYVKVNTVKTHVKNLYGKLGVHDRVQAVRHARELGLL